MTDPITRLNPALEGRYWLAKLVRTLGVAVGLAAVYFSVGIIGDARLDGLQDSGLAIAVALAYLTAGAILLIPWRIVKSRLALLSMSVLLLVGSVAGLAYGFAPALAWAFIHGAITASSLLIVLLLLLSLICNIALAFWLTVNAFRVAKRSPVAD